MKYIMICLLVLGLQSNASASIASRFVARQVQKKLTRVQNAFARENTNYSLLRGKENNAWYLKRIRLQYAAFVEFDVAIFELELKPIIEFRWSRNNPAGWVNYKKTI